jgi:predicted membrane-bound spermidine synthase
VEPSRPTRGVETVEPWLPLVFLLSGFAALVYQVVWQRALFAIFGLNIESVTVVVTAFMLGLGLGSLAGGALSVKPERSLLLWFAAAEAGIAAFGAMSLHVFELVGSATLRASNLITGVTTFLLLLLPTLLMGATVPLLVAHAVRISGNVGRSVSTLYFVNTLGSAVAAVLAVVLLLRFLGQQRSILVASALNATVALVVLSKHRGWTRARRTVEAGGRRPADPPTHLAQDSRGTST